MQVFKACFKIIKMNLAALSIYIIVFMFFALLLTFTGSSKIESGFSTAKRPIAFINNSSSSPLIDGLKEYLAETATFVDVGSDSQSLEDALFYRKIEFVVKVPKDFSTNFMNDTPEALLEKTSVPDSTSSIYIELQINKYLNTARIFKKSLPDLSEAQIAEYTKKNLSQEATVQLNSYNTVQRTGKLHSYFIYLAYSLMAIIILGVTSIMLVFNDSDLKRRNLCSPLKSLSMNLQLLLGNLVFALAAWAVMIIISLLIYHSELVLNTNTLLMILNALCFTVACLSMSFLIGSVIKSRGAQHPVSNVLSLGFCFISGVFIPQEFLGSKVQFFASFTPTYWYIKAINDLKATVELSTASLSPVFLSMLIQLGFAAALFIITLVITKQRGLETA